MIYRLIWFFFVILLVVGVPILSFLSTRDTRLRLVPRTALYFSAVVSQWLLTALGIVVVVTSMGFSSVGLRWTQWSAQVRWSILLIAVSLGVLGLSLLLERWGWWPEESELVRLLVPETRREKLWAVLVVAPTAALCEEFLYRGYLMAELSRWSHSASWAWAASSVAFGLAHSYQGISGMLRAAALGALLAYPVLHLGTLFPSIAAHFVVDAVALVWLAPRFMGNKAEV